ncbi:sulfite exporter TauE/SafE family protein [Bosea sp. 117]|uniref:sulfite exporter TauE/SafE family protein n=1 Tax=Bosea sp. 117 TaxID=1125973 RepID=UPI00049419E4|nr:sulfite exporter TauE/SafE family protein [Bosea sp. 117]
MPLDPALLWAASAALVAGITRGFSGFGGALIFMPLVSAAYGPEVAAPVLLAVDTVLTLPILRRALRACLWRQVLPLALAAVAMVPVGVAILGRVDPIVLRWALAGVALGLLVLLMSGWRHSGRPHLAVTLGVGALAGTLGGVAQMSGPPVVAYWIGGNHPAAQVRANLFGFFALVTVASALAYWRHGLFTGEVGRLSLILAPLYAIGLVGGSRAFAGASDRTYRRAAYVVIALAALLSLPWLDGLLRS